jgi:hypothetical protein
MCCTFARVLHTAPGPELFRLQAWLAMNERRLCVANHCLGVKSEPKKPASGYTGVTSKSQNHHQGKMMINSENIMHPFPTPEGAAYFVDTLNRGLGKDMTKQSFSHNFISLAVGAMAVEISVEEGIAAGNLVLCTKCGGPSSARLHCCNDCKDDGQLGVRQCALSGGQQRFAAWGKQAKESKHVSYPSMHRTSAAAAFAHDENARLVFGENADKLNYPNREEGLAAVEAAKKV